MWECTNPDCTWSGGWYELETRRDYAGIYQGQEAYEETKICPLCKQDVEYTEIEREE